jgi:hypothetical protein
VNYSNTVTVVASTAAVKRLLDLWKRLFKEAEYPYFSAPWADVGAWFWFRACHRNDSGTPNCIELRTAVWNGPADFAPRRARKKRRDTDDWGKR